MNGGNRNEASPLYIFQVSISIFHVFLFLYLLTPAPPPHPFIFLFYIRYAGSQWFIASRAFVRYAAPAAAVNWPKDNAVLQGRSAAALQASKVDTKAVAASFVVNEKEKKGVVRVSWARALTMPRILYVLVG